MLSNVITKTEKQTKKRKKPVFIIIGVLFSMQGISMYYNITKYKSKIYPKVWVEDIYVGGKTVDEAKKAIVENQNKLIAQKNITVKLNNKQYTIDTSKLDMKYNYIKVLDSAYDIGRKDNIFKNFLAINSHGEKVLKLKHTYNYNIVDTVLKEIVKENSKKATNATLIKNNLGQLLIAKEEYGYTVDPAILKQAIINKINNIEQEQNLIVQAELRKVEPKIKENDLKGVNTMISTVTTDFENSSENRSENIRVASSAINGKILMPGDIFSFNDEVGERSIERGYKTAKGIIDDKIVDDIGGGVCQVSTTLYNAILRTNIISVERYPHTLHSAYIGQGLDATVAYGLLDYRFKNTYSYPIYIESIVQNKTVTFNVYSNSILSNKKYEVINEVVGDKVNVFRVTYENGNLLSKSLLYTDTINPT
ncbi:VanW family protein [Clostridium tagluense]|uniref:Exported protein n=1 Tax=Clostridium tagluense TaxID=360422 RepID=A0A401UKY8_9CLOT|nr:VanW family protein [Clostridium tagluense]GCD10207.1 exported protein [Clostridium tagluense]